MSKRVFGEIIAGILVVATVFIPKIVFDRYLAYNDTYIVAAAEITMMAVTSLLIASAVYYIARRIREFFASHD